MPSDKEILYSMLDREIDNLLFRNPMLGMFSGTVKNYVHNFLDPYLNFFMEGNSLQVDMAASFANQEMAKKVEDFKKSFISLKEGQINE